MFKAWGYFVKKAPVRDPEYLYRRIYAAKKKG